MNYGLTASAQLSNFLSAVGFGFLIAVLYYTVVFIREVLTQKKAAIIAQDIIFFVLTSFLCFVFMQVYTNGEVRIDLIIAQVFGFFVFCICAKRLFGTAWKRAVSAGQKFVKAFFSPIVVFFLFIKKIYTSVCAFFVKLRKSHSEKMNNKKSKKKEKKEEKQKEKAEKPKRKKKEKNTKKKINKLQNIT